MSEITDEIDAPGEPDDEFQEDIAPDGGQWFTAGDMGGAGKPPGVATAAAGGDEPDDMPGRVDELERMMAHVKENLFPQDEVATSTGGAVVVKLISNATGGGKYNGRILTGSSTAVATGNLSMPEGMTVPGANDALILNLYESTSHQLAANSFHVGVPCGTSGGLTVVVIQALKVITC